jgi:hypothetical protein
MAKNIRNLNGYSVQDPSAISNLEYNPQAGAQKVAEVGRRLLPIPLVGATTFTTTPTSATALPSLGRNIAVYNNAGFVGSITLGTDSTVAVLAPGAVNNTTGQAGIPCMPNAWTYIATGTTSWVISSASTLLVFLIDDTSYIMQEVANYSNPNYSPEGGN